MVRSRRDNHLQGATEALADTQIPPNDSSLTSAEFWYELGRCYVDSNDFEKAKDAYSNALNMGLDDIRASHAHWEIAVCLMRKNLAQGLWKNSDLQKNAQTPQR